MDTARAHVASGQTSTLGALDFAKLVASLLVVSVHARPLGEPARHLASHLWSEVLARAAVPFFFAASGYLLGDAFRERKSVVRYVLRLAIVYGIWSLLYLPITLARWPSDDGGLAARLFWFARDLVFAGSFYHLWFFPALTLAVLARHLLLRRAFAEVEWLILGGLFLIGALGDTYRPLVADVEPLAFAYQKFDRLFVTTRGAFFLGLPLLMLGGLVRRRRIRLEWALIGTLASLVGLLLEGFLAFPSEPEVVHGHNFYFALLPLTFFSLHLFVEAAIATTGLTALARRTSTLVYVSHVAVLEGVQWLFPMLLPGWTFLSVASGASLFALGVLSLERAGFRALRFLA